jgi:beta-N-acetylhexosaminidase
MKYTKLLISAVMLSMMVSGCSAKKTESTADNTPAAVKTTAAATTAASASATAAPAQDSASRASAYLAQMDLKTKIEQMMVPAVKKWNGENFTVMNDEVAGILSTYHFGGMILFAQNMTSDASQAIQLTQSMQNNTISGGGAPLFIGTDQECGNVYRLLSGTDMPSSMALAATGDPQNAYTTGTIISKELQATGINLDYAPDLDVNANPANPVIGIRSYSDDPAEVAQYAKQFALGLEESNIIATGKHFPGHGDTAVDSHTGLPQVNKTKDELETTDLVPFKQASADGIEMIMSAHIQYPNIETGTYTSIKDGNEVYLPSTLSHVMITDILRNELGFQGVITTDSLQMDAIKDNFSTRDSAKLAINAGVDCLLMPVDLTDASVTTKLDSYIQDIEDMVNDGEISIDSINDAVTRILTLKYKHGIMDTQYGDAYTNTLLQGAGGVVGTADSSASNRTICDQAVTMLQNENSVIPYKAVEGAQITILSPNQQQSNAMGFACERLTREGILPESTSNLVISEDYGKNYRAADDAIAGSSLVIVSTIMFNGNDIDFNQSSVVSNMVLLLEHAKNLGIPVVAVSTGLPYDTPLLAEADSILCTYNWVGAPVIDESWNPTQAYAESLPAALDVIFGKVQATGKLPVNIYEIANGSFTSNILWQRGYSSN